MADQGEVSPESDPDFSPSERLFRRVRICDVVGDSVNDMALPSPSFSVNREKYSVARDVVEGHQGFRVAAFRVGDLPGGVLGDDGSTFRMGVEHEPLKENYSHSGVHTFNGDSKLIGKPSRQARKKLRDLLRRGVKILELEA